MIQCPNLWIITGFIGTSQVYNEEFPAKIESNPYIRRMKKHVSLNR